MRYVARLVMSSRPAITTEGIKGWRPTSHPTPATLPLGPPPPPCYVMADKSPPFPNFSVDKRGHPPLPTELEGTKNKKAKLDMWILHV